MTPLSRPRLPSNYDVWCEPPDEGGDEILQIVSERRRLKLKGHSFREFTKRVVPVLDGHHTWSEIQEHVADVFRPEDLDRVLGVLQAVAEAFAEDADYGPQLLERPSVLGPLSLGDWALTVRVMVKTETGKQWGVARELRKRILAACDREDITLPYPRQEVWVRNAEAGDQR